MSIILLVETQRPSKTIISAKSKYSVLTIREFSIQTGTRQLLKWHFFNYKFGILNLKIKHHTQKRYFIHLFIT